MKKLLNITASIQRPELMKEIVEQLVAGQDHSYSNIIVNEWKEMGTACVESYINAEISFSQGEEEISMPFTTGCYFVCTSKNSGKYEVSWLIPLS